MVLNEKDNESYMYLRSVGNNWQYDVGKVHEKLQTRLYKRFDTFDKDSDNVMTLPEVLLWADRIKVVFDATDEQVDGLRSAIGTFFRAVGVTNEGLSRENWVEANQVFAEAEFERTRRGEECLVALLSNAYFDVLDVDNNGTVSFEELRNMMKVFDIPEEAAYTFFERADVNHDGKLQRKEMHRLFSKFWLEEYDPQYDGIYAYKYWSGMGWNKLDCDNISKIDLRGTITQIIIFLKSINLII